MQNSSTRPLGAFAKRLSIFLIAVTILGCSAARLGFRNIETVTYWWLNGYIDIESEQKPWIKGRIAGLYDWHRKTQLKPYAQYLAQMQRRVEAPVSEADLLGDYEEVKKRLLTVSDHAMPDLAELALSLQPHQLAALEKKFANNNKDFQKDFLRGDLEQRQRYRYKKVLEQAEDWFGNFNREQEQQIRAASDARPLNNELMLAERMQRQKAMLALLKKIQAEKPGREATIALLKDYQAAVLDRFGDTEHKAFFEKYNAATARMTALIVNIATPAQKAHFVKKLQQWIDDFEAAAAGR